MKVARTTPRVGLDFEQTLMAAAQVKGSRQSQVLTSAAVQPLPEGLVSEGEIVDVGALAAQLKAFWKKNHFIGRRVLLGVANQKIVVRTMEFPVIDEKELRAAVEFQAQEHIPIPVEEAILDYQVTSTFTADDGSARQRILLVAAQRDMIRQFVEVARKAGLTAWKAAARGNMIFRRSLSPGLWRRCRTSGQTVTISLAAPRRLSASAPGSRTWSLSWAIRRSSHASSASAPNRSSRRLPPTAT